MTIWLTQALCPARHAAYALVWDDAVQSQATAEATVTAEAHALGLRPRCGICGGELHLESARSRFTTLAEAQPYVEAVQAASLATRRLLDGLGLTQESLGQ